MFQLRLNMLNMITFQNSSILHQYITAGVPERRKGKGGGEGEGGSFLKGHFQY